MEPIPSIKNRIREVENKLASLDEMMQIPGKYDDITAKFSEIVTLFENLRDIEKNEEDEKSFEDAYKHLRKVASELKDFSSIPPEVQIMIFSYLSSNDAVNAMQVSKEWKEFSDNQSTWRERVMSQPDIRKYLPENLSEVKDWKSFYKHAELLNSFEKLEELILEKDKDQLESLLKTILKVDPTGIRHMEFLFGKEYMDKAKTLKLTEDFDNRDGNVRDKINKMLTEKGALVKGIDNSGRHFFAFNILRGRRAPILSIVVQSEPDSSTWIINNFPGNTSRKPNPYILENGKPSSIFLELKQLFRKGKIKLLGFDYNL